MYFYPEQKICQLIFKKISNNSFIINQSQLYYLNFSNKKNKIIGVFFN